MKDDGGCFHVLPQAAVASSNWDWKNAASLHKGREMGLKHSACSQMPGRLQDIKVLYHLHISHSVTIFSPEKENGSLQIIDLKKYFVAVAQFEFGSWHPFLEFGVFLVDCFRCFDDRSTRRNTHRSESTKWYNVSSRMDHNN